MQLTCNNNTREDTESQNKYNVRIDTKCNKSNRLITKSIMTSNQTEKETKQDADKTE